MAGHVGSPVLIAILLAWHSGTQRAGGAASEHKIRFVALRLRGCLRLFACLAPLGRHSFDGSMLAAK
eukprot:6012847-Pyramimonas_sp.AAC.1